MLLTRSSILYVCQNCQHIGTVFVHHLAGHSGIIILHDEASTVLLRCKTKKELFCSARAQFYLLYGEELHPIKACMHGPNWKRTGGCGHYAYIRQVCKYVHQLMEVWLDAPAGLDLLCLTSLSIIISGSIHVAANDISF